MKYIKTYEGTKFIDDNHRKLYNFSQRLERALNNFFNITRKDYGYINVSATYNHKGEGYTTFTKYPIHISYHAHNLDPDKYDILTSELKRLKTNGNCMTVEQAEELLLSTKLGFIALDIEKYNL